MLNKWVPDPEDCFIVASKWLIYQFDYWSEDDFRFKDQGTGRWTITRFDKVLKELVKLKLVARTGNKELPYRITRKGRASTTIEVQPSIIEGPVEVTETQLQLLKQTYETKQPVRPEEVDSSDLRQLRAKGLLTEMDSYHNPYFEMVDFQRKRFESGLIQTINRKTRTRFSTDEERLEARRRRQKEASQRYRDRHHH
jgi:hypothetical protein